MNLRLNPISLKPFRATAAVSKYIGETEKNLSQSLSKADSVSLGLIFDESEGLFGKRTEVADAHDRYANLPPDTLC